MKCSPISSVWLGKSWPGLLPSRPNRSGVDSGGDAKWEENEQIFRTLPLVTPDSQCYVYLRRKLISGKSRQACRNKRVAHLSKLRFPIHQGCSTEVDPRANPSRLSRQCCRNCGSGNRLCRPHSDLASVDWDASDSVILLFARNSRRSVGRTSQSGSHHGSKS